MRGSHHPATEIVTRGVLASALLAFAVIALGAVIVVAEAQDRCVRIQGFSQTNNWTHPNQGGFMPREGFEVSVVGGASLRTWTEERHNGWDTVDHGECGDPTELAQHISGPLLGFDRWVTEIESYLGTARARFPGVPITLVAVVGHETNACVGVRANNNHPVIVDAIETVAAQHADVAPGPKLVVSDCSHFADSLGHLTGAGGQEAAAIAATWWGE